MLNLVLIKEIFSLETTGSYEWCPTYLRISFGYKGDAQSFAHKHDLIWKGRDVLIDYCRLSYCARQWVQKSTKGNAYIVIEPDMMFLHYYGRKCETLHYGDGEELVTVFKAVEKIWNYKNETSLPE